MVKAVYEDNHDFIVYIPYVKSDLDWIINVDHWPKLLLNEIEWIQFEGILEHVAFHAKGDNIIFNSLLKLFHMFSIRIWNDGGCNDQIICIKYNHSDRTVA